MKIAINCKKITGPWGGVNQFCNTLENRLTERGHIVVRSLDPDTQVILLAISSLTSESASFSYIDAAKHKQQYRSKIVHRINAYDGQRGSILGVTEAVVRANEIGDHTVFVSSFIRNIYLQLDRPCSIILNGCDESVFYPRQGAAEGFSLVTHHWSDNLMKGFEIYRQIDKNKELTLIGRIPSGYQFSRHLPPMTSLPLAEELSSHSAYITAAQLESGPNHPLEAMACGLPILYMDSGSMKEYCGNWGVEFDTTNLFEKIDYVKNNLIQLKENLKSFNLTSQLMAEQYANLFQALSERP